MHGVDNTARARRTRLTAEQRRESILKAATEVFAATGYRAGKVSDVAARVGVTEPVIFQNFGSKAALYAAVLDRVATEIRGDLQAHVGQYGSAPDLLAHVLSPSPGGPPHGPGSPGVLFADAATLTADPSLTEPCCPTRACSSPRISVATRSSTAAYSAAFEPKFWKITGSLTPTLAATSETLPAR